jgi:hypothetical protein
VRAADLHNADVFFAYEFNLPGKSAAELRVTVLAGVFHGCLSHFCRSTYSLAQAYAPVVCRHKAVGVNFKIHGRKSAGHCGKQISILENPACEHHFADAPGRPDLIADLTKQVNKR